MICKDSRGNTFDLTCLDHLRVERRDGKAVFFPFGEDLRLRVSSFTSEIKLRYRKEAVSLSALTPRQLGELLPELFRQWARKDPESAQKAAFDYFDAQRGFVPLAFAACLLVSLPVSVALLADSHQQFRCTRELKTEAVPGTIAVTKASKKDSRTFKVKLEFTTPQGNLIRAEDLVHTSNEKDVPKTLPILYSPSKPECWSLTKSPESNEINWAKRNYFGFFALFFGLFFLIATGLGLSWSLARWLNPRPFSKEIGSLFKFS